MADHAERQAVHEVRDINIRGVLWGVVAIAAGIVLAAIVAYLLWQHWNAPSGAQPFGGPNTGNLPRVAAPRLDSAPQPDRERYFAQQRKLLESWEWLDRPAGIARIPLEEAMRIMAARGEQKPSPAKGQP